ncbi:MAG: M42 family metallopeptidase [Anaerolineae bacterium]
MKLLKKLSESQGIPGREDRIRTLVTEEMRPLVDDLRIDPLGNVIGHKRGKGKVKVMIAAHMDEIGFMVNHIDDKGFLRILPVGGWDPRTMIAQRVTVHGQQDLPGIIGTKPVHILTEEEKKKPLKVKDFFIDVGLPPEKVKELVSVGDVVTMVQEMSEIGEAVTGKSFDDRLGIYVMLEALRKVPKHEVDIYAVASVQEEVGLRGAIVSSYGIEPHAGIALDVTIASDTPGSEDHERVTLMGGGTAIKLMDSSSISDYKLVQFFKDIAAERKIKYQLEILPRGGTDAGAIQRTKSGAPVITISIPTRYVHSVVEMAHKEDIQASINLLTAFLEVAHQGLFTTQG